MAKDKYEEQIDELYKIIHILATGAVGMLSTDQHKIVEKIKAQFKLKEAELNLEYARKALERLEADEKPKYPTVDDLADEMSVRASNGLINNPQLGSAASIIDVAEKTEGELKSVNFGRKSLAEVREVLAVYGLRLAMSRADAEKEFVPKG